MTVNITPQYLAALLDTHAIGADAPGGSGSIVDQSLDRDMSEVTIAGVYDLSAVALELNDIDSGLTVDPRSDRIRTLMLVLNVVLLIVVIVMASK